VNGASNNTHATIDIGPHRINLDYNPSSLALAKPPIEPIRKFSIKSGLPHQLDNRDTVWKSQIVPEVSMDQSIGPPVKLEKQIPSHYV